ncbi:MAG TPA: hypothetical protein VMS98_19610 [Thermoanaerobaculia bacterium]|nr:hypothetical protein [Thermoanaerobaculia bacterium]
MKTSKTPLILGGCGCLSILISLALFGAYWFTRDAMPSFMESARQRIEQTASDAMTEDQTSRPADVERYVNSPDGRTGNLSNAYVGFEFDYPRSWIVKPQGADSINFVAVERRFREQTWESFTVGYFNTAGSREANEQLYSELVNQLGAQFEQQFGNLQRVREGSVTVGANEGYEGLFQSTVDAAGTPVQVYIRSILLPTPDGTKGVTLLMLGTSYHPELSSPEDLGVKGEMPLALESFRFTE